MGLGTAVALASLGMSAYQGFKGAQASSAANKAAEQAAEQALRIREENKFASLKVPTLGTELAQQNIQAQQASTLRALQESGAAGVLGGLTGLGQQSQAQNLQLAAQADEMQYQRDMAQAQNAQQIEQGRMQREFAMNQAKLGGAQAAAAEGRQQVNTAIAGGLGALSNLATLDAYKDMYGKNDASKISKGTQFLGDIGYSLGLGGTNATPVSETMFTANEALKPVIRGMAPTGIQPQSITNVGMNQMQNTLTQQQQLDNLRNPQFQFQNQYRWNPYTNQWGLRQ
jgi:hypothetical protein